MVSVKRPREAGRGETVLVAAAEAAARVPPVRSGRRVDFTILDDGTGLTDLAFFDDSHAACAQHERGRLGGLASGPRASVID